MFKNFDTRSGEILSALLALAIGLGLFTAPDSTPAVTIMREAMPEWAIANIVTALVCIAACFASFGQKIKQSARFLSGCIWGTFILMFATAGQWALPLFGVASVMFAFDVYLVAVKGQTWAAKDIS